MTRRVLGLSTYPAVRPRHGGQLRIEAIKAFYETFGHDYHCVAVYEAPAYGPGTIGPDDVELGYMDPRWQGLPFLGDLSSGTFAAESPAAYAHFCAVVERLCPDVVQLEHPFLWPLVRRLRKDGRLAGVPIVYSSHNWEGPLKESILLGAGVTADKALALRTEIEALEAELADAASVIIAVSRADAEVYRGLTDPAKVHVAPNGTSRPPPAPPADAPSPLKEHFGDNRFMLFAGSAYPPNIDGFCRLVADGGFFFLPPAKSLAVCGGASHGIFVSREYQRFLHGNSNRVQFLPDLDDAALWTLKGAAHAFLLPIAFGGGTNLKSAEAIASGRWVVTTSTAMRGREDFADAPGVVVADTPKAFRRAMIEVMNSPPLKLTPAQRKARDQAYWDRVLANSGVQAALQTLAARPMEAAT